MSRIGYIGLGSNMGDRLEWIRRALWALQAHSEVTLCESSSIYETAPMYMLDQPAFLNACARVQTELEPEQLLGVLLQIELLLGRRRDIDKGPRTLDLDLLLMEGVIHNTPALTLPHPGLHERAFVLVPLLEIAPELVHPTRHESLAALLDACTGRDEVKLHQRA
jgi:2-amino-4-hydroxy-6-hydroxymethyldihydropteridine diphosphokinase